MHIMTETKTVAELGNRLVKMQIYFTKNNIKYTMLENRSGVETITIEYENEQQKQKADSYEAELILNEKCKLKNKYNSIKELRSATDLSQSAFSKVLGIPMRTVVDWEYGNRKCREYMLNLIETKLRVVGYIN